MEMDQKRHGAMARRCRTSSWSASVSSRRHCMAGSRPLAGKPCVTADKPPALRAAWKDQKHSGSLEGPKTLPEPSTAAQQHSLRGYN